MGIYIDKFINIAGLSLSLAKAKFNLRNEGTWLGVFWYLLAPIITFLLLLSIFQDRLGNNIPNYPLYLFLGIIIFNYTNNILTESVIALKSRAGIIKSMNFPRESLIGSIVLSSFFSHIFEIIILMLFLLFFGISIKMLIFYPILLFFISIFAFGSSLILSSLGIYFFDLDNIWKFFSKVLWLGTPIFYAIEGQTRLFYLNLFNPFYYFITIAREVIIYSKIPEIELIMGALFYTLLALFLGLVIFNKLKPKFAELI